MTVLDFKNMQITKLANPLLQIQLKSTKMACYQNNFVTDAHFLLGKLPTLDSGSTSAL